MNDKTIVIFSGFNQRAIIAFNRVLEKYKIKYAIVAVSKNDPIFLTKYKKKVVSIRNIKELNIEDILVSINEVKNSIPSKEYLIVPSSEALNRFLLKYRNIFKNIGCKIPLVEKNIYELISDKYSFNNLCKQNGIEIPIEYKNFNNIKIPFVAKPKTYFSNSGKIFSPVIIKNTNERDSFLKNHNLDDFFFQEYIKGESFYLLYYFNKKGGSIKYSQKNIVQQPNGKSIVAAIASNFHLENESSKYENLFKKIGFHGLIMIEVKKARNNNIYMIEANPRFWGPSQLFVDANVPFFEYFLRDNNISIEFNENINYKKNYDIRYFWFGGLYSVLNAGKALTFHEGNEKKILLELPRWLSSDIYCRKDTIEYFKKELQL